MLTNRQKTASRLIAQAGAAKTMQARARNLAKVIEALGLPGREMVVKAVELRAEAKGADPFEMLAAQCYEKLGMYYSAGQAYLARGLRKEAERLIEQCSQSVFNAEKFHAAMLLILLPDYPRAARIAAEIEVAEIDFLTMDRSRENEGAFVQNNLVLAGKIYAELASRGNWNGMTAGDVIRVADALKEDSYFGEAALLHSALGDEKTARTVAAMMSYDPDRIYDDEIFLMLMRLGMKDKAVEMAESILNRPGRLNRTVRAAEIFMIIGDAARAARIYLECERHLDATVALNMER